MPLKAKDTIVKSLGVPKINTPFTVPIAKNLNKGVLYKPYVEYGAEDDIASFEASVPSSKIYFDPKKVTAAIVTCGGLCPGLNNVIRSIVLRMWHGYGVRKIQGVQFGFQGFIADYGLPFIELNPQFVSEIHELGGTVLGSSRGEQPIEDIVDTLERQAINILFCVGGDGTLRATLKIQEEVEKRGLKISVIGIPKTIDNDISYIQRSFGFETAVDQATNAIKAAHAEAKSYPNGVGLVKLMGRHSGFIAATAALSQRDVNYVLIPEVDFDLDGEKGFLTVLKKRIETRGHAVVVVAEGAGQKFFEGDNSDKDASGNLKLKDIGRYLADRIKGYFDEQKAELNLKYIDPSYMIRSVPANTNDGLFCATLGQNAVHAAMSGKTAMVVSMWHGVYCQLPIKLSISERKALHPCGRLWLDVLESTGQPDFINDPKKQKVRGSC